MQQLHATTFAELVVSDFTSDHYPAWSRHSSAAEPFIERQQQPPAGLAFELAPLAQYHLRFRLLQSAVGQKQMR